MCVSPISAIGTSGMWLDDTEVTPLHFGLLPWDITLSDDNQLGAFA
jgi:hypothetical protein